MSISVIVPIYKVEKYLNQCIDSLVNQSIEDLEIILVDDGSPDECPAICDEYAEKDNRIKVIHKENGGLIEARKSGVKAAKGDYIAFVDGDDYVSPKMYYEVSKAIDKYSPDIIMTEFFWSYEKKDIPSERTLFKEFYNREDIENDIIPTMLFNGKYYQFNVFPNCWTKIVKKEILEKNIMCVDSRVRMGEDAAFTYNCILDCNSIVSIQKPLYYYRIINSSMSKSYDPTLSSTWCIAYNSIALKAENSGIDLSEQLRYYLLYMMNILVRNEASKNNGKSKRETRSALKSLLNDDYINEIKLINSSILPLHTKVLLKLFINKKIKLIYMYSVLLRRFL